MTCLYSQITCTPDSPCAYCERRKLKTELAAAYMRLAELKMLLLIPLSAGWGCMSDVERFRKKIVEKVK